MTAKAENLIISTLAKGSTAELRTLAKKCDDRDTARGMYVDVMAVANELSRKFNFSLTEEAKTVKN